MSNADDDVVADAYVVLSSAQQVRSAGKCCGRGMSSVSAAGVHARLSAEPDHAALRLKWCANPVSSARHNSPTGSPQRRVGFMAGVQTTGCSDLEVGSVSALVVAPIPRYEPDPVSETRMVPREAAVAARPRIPEIRRPGRPIADRVDPSARGFAVSALTMLLEIIDRRRPVAQLSSVAAAHIVDQVSVWTARPQPAATSGARPPAATLLRVHLQWSGPDAAEVSATYSRGARVRAIAARVQRVPVRVRPAVPGGPRTTELRWMLVNVTTA